MSGRNASPSISFAGFLTFPVQRDWRRALPLPLRDTICGHGTGMPILQVVHASSASASRDAGRPDGDDLLKSALEGCDLRRVVVVLERLGGSLVFRNRIVWRHRTKDQGRALARTNGRRIEMRRDGAPEHSMVWAAAHCLAHMIQWQSATPRDIHPDFRVARDEARHWSTTPLETVAGRELDRAIRQELEAHLLTAAILQLCMSPDRRGQLEEAAMAKARDDLVLLAMGRRTASPRSVRIFRAVRRFRRTVRGWPTLRQQRMLKPVRGRFVPYLLVSAN